MVEKRGPRGGRGKGGFVSVTLSRVMQKGNASRERKDHKAALGDPRGGYHLRGANTGKSPGWSSEKRGLDAILQYKTVGTEKNGVHRRTEQAGGETWQSLNGRNIFWGDSLEKKRERCPLEEGGDVVTDLRVGSQSSPELGGGVSVRGRNTT